MAVAAFQADAFQADAFQMGEAVTVTPGVVALTLTTFAPSAAIPVIFTPGVVSLTLTTFAPNVVPGDPTLATPATASLTVTTFVPTVVAPQDAAFATDAPCSGTVTAIDEANPG